MKFKHITYEGGTGTRSKEVEIYNFHKGASVFAEYGFDCVRLSNDWRGADFLAYHKQSAATPEVQLKTCLVIDERYEDNSDLYVCFPLDKTGKWYLLKHSRLLEIVQKHHHKLWATYQQKRKAWHYTGKARARKGLQTRDELLEALEEYAYEPRYGAFGFRECTQRSRRGH